MRLLTIPLASLLTLTIAASASAAGEPILPLSQVTPGMSCTAKSVLSGTTPTEFPVTIKDIYRDGGQNWLLVEVSGAAEQSGIAAGMSGSPVYCPSANGPAITGALSYGIGEWGDRVGLATPIEAMLGQAVTAASYDKAPKVVAQAIDKASSREPVYVSGASKYALRFLSKRYPQQKFISGSNGGTLSATTLGSNTILNPGDSLGVFNVTGDMTMGGIGTVTYRDDNRMWAFGHPWDDAGPRSTWISEAPITTVINNGKTDFYPSYKLGSFGPTVGKLDYDGPYAVSGVFGQEPKSLMVETKVSGSGLKSVTNQSIIADESDLGWPAINWDTTGNPLDIVSALTSINAVSDSFSETMPGAMTLNACWQISVETVKDPFSFCRRYAGMWGDPMMGLPLALYRVALDNFGITETVDDASFANLKVSKISTSITAARGGQLAKLQKVKQSGKSRNITISYLNNKSETKTFTAKIPKVKNKKGKTLSLKAQTVGSQSEVVSNIPLPSDPTSDGSAPSTPEVPQIGSVDEMAAYFASLDGVNVLAGKVGSKRFSVKLPSDMIALPVGKVSTRLR